MLESRSESYAKAGVDVVAGYESVEKIKPLVESTMREGVLGGLGGFGGMFELNVKNMKRPVTVSGTDGVGTKLKIAFMTDKHDTIGIDCVAMCVNDIVCAGAEPLFFLDYLAMGKNYPDRTAQIVKGIADGCRQAGCALIGGETAEMPGFYPVDEYDVAGFSVGLVDYDRLIDGRRITAGDIIIGLESSGVHSNGFSLIRKVFEEELKNVNAHVNELGRSLGEELLTPTRIYVKQILQLINGLNADIKGISHITGGGLYENAPRMLPDGVRIQLEAKCFPEKPIFNMLAEKGQIPLRDMFNTFNMGIGMVIAVKPENETEIIEELKKLGEKPRVLGSCVAGEKGVDIIW